MTDYNESVFVTEAQLGSEPAFEDLVKRYEKNLFRLCLRITRFPEDAEEALQETFLKAYEHLKEFQGKSSFWTWLARIAINEVMMKLRRRQAESVVFFAGTDHETDDGEATGTVDKRLDPEQVCLQTEVQALVRKAIRNLPPSLKAAALLRYVGDYSMQETAETLNESMPAIKTKLFRARIHLRKELEGTFGNGRVPHTARSPHSNQRTCARKKAKARRPEVVVPPSAAKSRETVPALNPRVPLHLVASSGSYQAYLQPDTLRP